jgi:hypothetical protein
VRGWKKLEIHSAFNNCNSMKHIKFPSTITVIRNRAFLCCNYLTKVELNEGLLEIEACSFYECNSLNEINIPATTKIIGRWAFSKSNLKDPHLPDGLENIGGGAFCDCKLTNFKIPPLVTTIPRNMLKRCKSMVPLKISANLIQIDNGAFGGCISPRNIALSPSTVVDEYAFYNFTDLLQVFGVVEAIITALRT